MFDTKSDGKPAVAPDGLHHGKPDGKPDGKADAKPNGHAGAKADATAAGSNWTKPPAPDISKIPMVTAKTPANDKSKLVGQNYVTPDLVAKVTGRSKYAEDYRADGMLFTKLLLSPYPHARVLNIDASEAMAMPGVKGYITMDDLPAPADSVTDLGVVIKASKRGERGLAMEPIYQGEPILALAAVDELTAANAIEKIKVSLPANCRTWWIRFVAPAARRSQMRAPMQHLDASAGSSAKRWRPAERSAASSMSVEVKWTGGGVQGLRRRQDADGEANGRVDIWGPGGRIQECSSGSR